MKKELWIFLFLFAVTISMSFVSANIFTNFLNKITGKTTTTPTTTTPPTTTTTTKKATTTPGGNISSKASGKNSTTTNFSSSGNTNTQRNKTTTTNSSSSTNATIGTGTPSVTTPVTPSTTGPVISTIPNTVTTVVKSTNVTEPTKTIVTFYKTQVDNQTKAVTAVAQTKITSNCENGLKLCTNNKATFCSSTDCPVESVPNTNASVITTPIPTSSNSNPPKVIQNTASTITLVTTQVNPTTTLVSIYTTPTTPIGATKTVTTVTQLYVVDQGCGFGFTLQTINNVATCSR